MSLLKGWEIPLRDYMTTCVVYPFDADPWAAKVRARADVYFADACARHEEETLVRTSSLGPEGEYQHYLMSRIPETVLLTSNGQICGGMMELAPWIFPEWRGKNLGARLIADTEEAGYWMEIEAFSIPGLFSRVRAHELHVQRALRRGDPVPCDVMNDYTPDGRLKEPYSLEEHQKRCKKKRPSRKILCMEY